MSQMVLTMRRSSSTTRTFVFPLILPPMIGSITVKIVPFSGLLSTSILPPLASIRLFPSFKFLHGFIGHPYSAFRTGAVAEERFGMLSYVTFQLLPTLLVIPDLLAVHADGNDAFELLHLGKGGPEFQNEPLPILFCLPFFDSTLDI